MLWLAAAREGLDDDHAAAAAWAWLRQHARLLGFGGAGGVRRAEAGRAREQNAGGRGLWPPVAPWGQGIRAGSEQPPLPPNHEGTPERLAGLRRSGRFTS